MIKRMKIWSVVSTGMLILLACHGDSMQIQAGSTDPYLMLSTSFPGLEEVSAGLSISIVEHNAGVKHLLPAFQLWYGRFPDFPGMARELCMDLVEGAKDPPALLYHAFSLLGAPAGGYGPPLSGIRQDFQEVSISFSAEGERQWRLLPAELREGIRSYLMAWEQCNRVLQQFTAPLLEDLVCTGSSTEQLRDLLTKPWKEKQLYDFASVDLIKRADLRKLSFASRLLSESLKELAGLYPISVVEDFKGCVLQTAMGDLGIFGAGRDTITAKYGLLLELGGDDLYTGSIASADPEQSISVVVDFGGSDNYRPSEGHLALACPGIAMLIDLEGDDQYHSTQAGLAAAFYGTSLLVDLQGDDSYVCNAEFSQGAAHLGTAMLIDLGGNDHYDCGGSSQGYGGTLGIGILLDLKGEDIYNQYDTDPSFVQGAGRGRWAQFSDGHSLGGGLGIFVEAGGTDRYSAGSFSQGASYFTGTGLFMDLEGDDRYDVLSHSQGFGAHYGYCGFFELHGNDVYNAGSDHGQISQMLGNGRDYSAACFVDEGGDDTYHMGNRSGGIGDLRGIGLMWDWMGRDTIIWHKNSVNTGSPSLGQTLGLSNGMAIESASPEFPADRPSGWFRSDGSYKLLTGNKH